MRRISSRHSPPRLAAFFHVLRMIAHQQRADPLLDLVGAFDEPGFPQWYQLLLRGPERLGQDSRARFGRRRLLPSRFAKRLVTKLAQVRAVYSRSRVDPESLG